mgnify:FL=1
MWKHPLLRYIKEVKALYAYKHNPIQDWNFKHWLEYLSEQAEKAYIVSLLDLLKVFEPLDMTVDNEYVLFHYKGFIDLSDMGYSEATFFYLYDGLYRECRSCVFDVKKEEIVLASLPKWKNYNEDAFDWSEKVIREKYISAQKIWITNKMDGSYQQFRYITNSDDSGTIFGSGSQAISLNESWRLKEGLGLLTDSQKQMIKDYPDYTFIFEFISTKNAIVVHYTEEQEGMYLISVRSCVDGTEMDFDTVRSIAALYDSKMVEYYDSENLDSLLAQVDNFSSDEKEGWVIRMRDENGNDFRVKIKCTDYVLLHRVISKRISPNAVIEALAYDKYDDFYSKVPDAFKDIVKGFYLETVNYVNTRTAAAMNWYYQMMEELKDQLENYPENYINKLKMVWISENVPKCIASDVRNMVNEKETQYLIRRGSPYRHAEILKLKNQHEKAIRQAKERHDNFKKEE